MPDDVPHFTVTVARMGIADQRLGAAIAESAYAPPDNGFANRLRAISEACLETADVMREAAQQPKLAWNPVTKQKATRLTYELRPGGNRPGPGHLWDIYDASVEQLLRAQAGTDFVAVADAYAAIGNVLSELAGRVDELRGAEAVRARKAG